MGRFRLLEMQAILIELLDNFEFSPAPGNIEIFRGSAGMMTPMYVLPLSLLMVLISFEKGERDREEEEPASPHSHTASLVIYWFNRSVVELRPLLLMFWLVDMFKFDSFFSFLRP